MENMEIRICGSGQESVPFKKKPALEGSKPLLLIIKILSISLSELLFVSYSPNSV
jgi:hypothetical protein